MRAQSLCRSFFQFPNSISELLPFFTLYKRFHHFGNLLLLNETVFPSLRSKRHFHLFTQNNSIHFLLSIQWPSNDWHPIHHALQRRVPTAMAHETSCRRVGQDLGLRGPRVHNHPNLFRPIQKTIRQEIKRRLFVSVKVSGTVFFLDLERLPHNP
ncbi:hypothetical protein F8388_003982 [Cannabis sativa]|uniref:Uncharacterized protein n=1 Tax=Cannabis sativa TaxID=3483 RepID=A0A7J6GP24_CANSA|nr:hypothetical protein F8388_003982 [Cannabis sativa]